MRTIKQVLQHPKTKALAVFALAGLALGTSLLVNSQSSPASNALLNIANEPLYLNATKIKPTLLLSLSVEFPTVGSTFRDEFNITKKYIGYFDSNACYKYSNSNTRFVRKSTTTTMTCDGMSFSGNFMNWASTSAVDILRLALTGGDRVVDTTSETTLQRAVIPERFYNNQNYFPARSLPAGSVTLVMPSKVAAGTGTVFIANCLNKIHFGTSSTGTCNSPGDNAAYGVKSASSVDDELSTEGKFITRVGVCDNVEGLVRSLCKPYPNNGNLIHKPIGNLQKSSDRVRIGVLGYLRDDSVDRYGGVLRAPMKYVGDKYFDNNFNLIEGSNPKAEWSESTGIFVKNPEKADEGNSGVANYLNQFGRTGAVIGEYKAFDPMAELYYEGIRYLQGLQPTAQAVSNVSNVMKDGFPYYSSWTDPHPAMSNTTDYSCLRNNILQIGDKNTHRDKSIPGSDNWTGQFTEDFKRGSTPNSSPPVPNFHEWTKAVGGFESNKSVNYLDYKGVSRVTNVNPNSANVDRWGMENQITGSTNASYFMPGIAYWANTQDIRADRGGMRVKTYVVDVNEGGASSNQNTRRNTQLFLTAKYGGFDDRNSDGNPFSGSSNAPDNTKWENPSAPGEAKNYFLASDAQAVLDAINTIFDRITEETGSIAGGAVASQKVSPANANATYQASFDPKTWGGSLKKFAISLDKNVPTVNSGATWDAGDLLKSRVAGTSTLGSDGRNIVIGNLDKRLTPASDFKWNDLQLAHKSLLNINPSVEQPDELGEDRLKYLRGFRGSENPNGSFRMRSEVLGDIVGSGIVYVGSPTSSISGNGYSEFFKANESRRSAVYAGANDGMLHAFDDSNGKELFAYIPSFLTKKLVQLPRADYVHTSFVDSTPAIREAKVGSNWKTVLVSGAGAGAQGVFALDVTNPSAFTKNNVMWEFTDADDANLGYVVGQPRIVKMRTTALTSTVPEFKHFAVFASGINSHQNDGNFNTTGKPSIFILDLAKAFNSDWTLGSNYWRIDLPQSSTARTFGISEVSEPIVGNAGEAQTFYSGDLQGNVWKLDFTTVGKDKWNASGVVFNKDNSNNPKPFFIAKDAAGQIQPITAEIAAAYAFAQQYFVLFGTGKFIESTDIASSYQNQSFYSILDTGIQSQQPSGRTVLQKVEASSSQSLTPTAAFEYGYGTGKKAGWYFDFYNATSTGERQLSDIKIAGDGRTLVFGSMLPATAGCGLGGGYVYVVDLFTANGISILSNVGILSSPILIEVGSTLGVSDSKGKREQTTKTGILVQGSSGTKFLETIKTSANPTGRIYWRQIHNYDELNKQAKSN